MRCNRPGAPRRRDWRACGQRASTCSSPALPIDRCGAGHLRAPGAVATTGPATPDPRCRRGSHRTVAPRPTPTEKHVRHRRRRRTAYRCGRPRRARHSAAPVQHGESPSPCARIVPPSPADRLRPSSRRSRARSAPARALPRRGAQRRRSGTAHARLRARGTCSWRVLRPCRSGSRRRRARPARRGRLPERWRASYGARHGGPR